MRVIDPRKALRGGISKSIIQRPCQFLAINAHKMAPRTTLEYPREGPSVEREGGGRQTGTGAETGTDSCVCVRERPGRDQMPDSARTHQSALPGNAAERVGECVGDRERLTD